MRATVSLPTPIFSPRVRVLQCVDPSSGDSSSVTRTTSATVPAGSHELRPRPLAMRPTPSTPSSLSHKTATPRPHRVRRHLELPCHLVDRDTVSRQEEGLRLDPRAMRHRRGPGDALELISLFLGDFKWRGREHWSHARILSTSC